VGGLVRAGTPGRLSLFGGSVSFERAGTSDLVQVLGPDGAEPDSGPPLGFRPAVALSGAARGPCERAVGRACRLVPARGGLRVAHGRAGRAARLPGEHDARAQHRALGTRDDDYFVSASLYAGMGGGRSFLANELRGEARHDNSNNDWRGGVIGGRSAWYLVPNARWRFVTSAEYSGVWRPRVPVQIRLGTRDNGVRGYNGAVEAGNARAVLRAESRYVLGALGNIGDLGAAAFVDAGKLWAGGAPYGVNSPVRASIGLGALGAFPRGSRKLWRVDVVRPLARVEGAPKFQLSLENRDLTRFFWREPRDVELGRERGVAGQRVQLAVRRSSGGRAAAGARRRPPPPRHAFTVRVRRLSSGTERSITAAAENDETTSTV
jgi:hypothetical protein